MGLLQALWKLREPSLTALMGDRGVRNRVSVCQWRSGHRNTHSQYSELVKVVVNRKAAATGIGTSSHLWLEYNNITVSRVQTPHWGLRMANMSLNCSECRMVLDEMTEYWIRETQVTGATCTIVHKLSVSRHWHWQLTCAGHYCLIWCF